VTILLSKGNRLLYQKLKVLAIANNDVIWVFFKSHD